MNAFKSETFTVTHQDNQYHYTLYYYDQAGNLEKTVPPAAVTPTWRSTWLDSVKTFRAAGTTLVPTYSLLTNYRYNSLNQVVAQLSPDGGEGQFWYDRLGRLAISQNAKQNPNDEYSYTQYDSIGRIYQVGELTNSSAMSAATSRNAASLLTWLNGVSSTMEQITQTVYDYQYSPLEPELYAVNLRNRVAYTSYYALESDISSSTPTQATTTYYSYDILGNVDTLVQDYHYGVMNSTNNRFKKIVYNYDLQSGKVDQVAYQHGSADAFYHTYAYDAENRLTNVQTSADSINWDNDAFYSYYLHGPLARTVLGDQQVQGLNYAYTLQGWMKAINPPVYSATGYTLTKDGSSGTPVGSNAYNLLLNYYQGDDSLVSGATGADVSLNLALGTSYRPLYNGNISSMGVNVAALTHPLLYNYQYDQLNRIVHMDAWNNTGATWDTSSKLTDFEEAVTYDPNGNILTYSRNGNNTFAGSPLAMDNLTYNYTAGTNKLDHIADAVSSSNYPNDIDNQSSGNYSYDAIGELTADNASSITGITWTVYGKINTISKSGGVTISFTYDAAGNRISKIYNNGSGTTIVTWYVRDAQGNVLSVYTSGDATINSGDLSQTESDLYGSSRLGMLKSATDVYNLATVMPTTLPLLGQGYPLIFTRGNKLFELSNHLGNVLATISDKKLEISTDGSTVDHFNPQVLDANDYYPFGSLEPGRTYAAASAGNYRYGFNGKEDDNEVKGVGDQQDYGMRGYDPRVGRFLSIDPIAKQYPELTPYQFASNTPIQAIDLDGKEGLFSWYISPYHPKTPAAFITADVQRKIQVFNESRTGKFVHGTWTTATGIVGIISSVSYIGATDGTGAALGGLVGFSFSATQTGIGVAQMMDAFSPNPNEILQESGNLPGLIAYGMHNKYASFIDAAGGLIPSAATATSFTSYFETIGGLTTAFRDFTESPSIMNTIGLIDQFKTEKEFVLESINLRNNYNEEGTKLTSQTLDYSLSYTARKGDNLSAIANKLHTSVKILADQNHISNPDRINVGQKISYSNQQTEKTN